MSEDNVANDNDPAFADDLLRGAGEIANFLFGEPSMRRKVYHLADTSNIPVFKLGSMICARKSVLLAWIRQQEERHANDNGLQPGSLLNRSA